MDNLNQDLTSLLRRAGLDNSGGEWGSRILLVAGIVLICYLAVKLFRHLVTPALQRIRPRPGRCGTTICSTTKSCTPPAV